MSRRTFITVVTIAGLLQACIVQKPSSKVNPIRSSPFQQVDFQTLVKRYMKKNKPNPIEGIYSVSGTVTKKGKGFLGGAEKEKTTDRQDNYAKVAIIQDPEDTGRDYIELSLDKDNQPSYSIVGEFSSAAGGNLLVYKHLDGKGKNTSYTFTTDKNSDIMEGIRVESEGKTTVTYKLTYVKLTGK